MKIIVLSDSHGDRMTIEHVAKEAADAYFHCGDSEIAESDPVFQSMFKVRGNCDMDHAFPNEVEATVGTKKVWMVHGHHHNIKSSLMTLFYKANEKEVDIVLFGHSHLYGAEVRDGILFVNPGSVLLPRGGNPATYAVIEWDEEVTVTFKDLDNKVVESATFSIS